MAKDKTVKRGVYLYIDGKEIKNDVNSIDLEIKRLTRDIKDMTRDSDEYNRTVAKIRSLKGILAEHNSQLKITKNNIRKNTTEAEISHKRLGKLADGFNRYFGMVSSFIAGITGFFLTMRKAVTDYLSLDSAYSDVMKYTGKTREEVVELNAELKNMDTKTARVELNSLVSDAGKLGIKGKQDLLDFAYAGDVIRVSLGEDLGKDAIKNIGKLAQMFGDSDALGLKNAMLAIGSSINDVAQNSSAAEPYLVEFTNRMAGIGKQANMSIPQIIGFASVLDQNGQQLEMSSTALSGVMMKIFKDPAKLARIAGLEVKSFSKLVREDANEALLQLLQTLGQKGGMNQLAPIFDEMKLDGARASQVLSVLAGKVDSVRQQQQQATQAFKDGTSVVNEFNTKNNDLTAQMMKAKKVFQERIYQLGEQLLPIMTKLVSGSSLTIRVLNQLITLGIKYGDVILVLTSVLGSYYLILKSINIYQAISNSLIKVGTTLKIIHAAAVANLSGNLSGANKILLLFNGNLSKNSLVVKACTALTYLYAAAKAVLTGNISKAIVATKAFNSVVFKNPWIALAALIIGAAVAIYKFATKTTIAQEAAKEFIAESERERKELKKLTDAAQQAGDGTERRKDLIKEINSKYGKYLTNLLDEKSSLNDIKRAYVEINRQMDLNIAKKILNEKQEAISRKYLDKKVSEMNKIREMLRDTFSESMTQHITRQLSDLVTKSMKAGVDINKVSLGLSQKIKSIFYQGADVPSNLANQIKDYMEVVRKEYKDTKELETQMSAFVPGVTNTNEIPEVVVSAPKVKKKDPSGGDSETETKKTKRIKKELEAIDAEFLQKEADLKKKYMASDTMTREEYAKEFEKLELDKLEKQLTIAELEPKKREEIANKILDYSIKLKEQLAELDKNSELDPEAQNKKEFDAIRKKYDVMRSIVIKANEQHILSEEAKNKILNDIAEKQTYEEKKNGEKRAELLLKQKDKALEKEVFLLNERRISENMSEEKYDEALRELKIKHLNELLRITGLSEAQVTELQSNLQALRLEKNKENLEKTKEQHLQYASIIEDVLSSFAEETAAFLMDNEASFKDYLKSLLITMLNALEKIVDLTIIETTIKGIKDGPKGWIVAALKIAAIKAAFAGARGIIDNFYDGGFTGHGSWNQPQGVVHSDEFVSNRFAVANPHLRPVFDLIDYAQRTGTVSNLTSNDILSVSKNGMTSATLIPKMTSEQSIPSSIDYNAMIILLGKMTKTINNLNKRLDEPIFTYTKASGKFGVNEAQKLIERMNNNVSRNK